jgi:hypothetical protein
MDAMKWHKRLHLTYNMDEPGFKLTLISDNKKLLAVKCSNNSPCYSEEKEKP